MSDISLVFLAWLGLALWLWQAAMVYAAYKMSRRTGRGVNVGVMPALLGAVCLFVAAVAR